MKGTFKDIVDVIQNETKQSEEQAVYLAKLFISVSNKLDERLTTELSEPIPFTVDSTTLNTAYNISRIVEYLLTGGKFPYRDTELYLDTNFNLRDKKKESNSILELKDFIEICQTKTFADTLMYNHKQAIKEADKNRGKS